MKIKLPEPFFYEAGKRAVLLFHSFTGSTVDVRTLGKALQRAGYTAIGINFTGHGTGKIEDTIDLSAEEWIQDGERSLQEVVSKGFDQVATFGLSLGGSIATNLIIHHPDHVIGGGIFSTPITATNLMETSNVPSGFHHFAVMNFQLRGMETEKARQEADVLMPQMQQVLQEISQLGQETTQELNKIEVPYFIAVGDKDEMVDIKEVEGTKNYIKKAPVTVHHYANSPHALTVGPDRKAFSEDLISFLDSLEWRD